MVESLVWNKKSIIDLTTDTMYSSSGTASVSGGNLTLGPNSMARFSYSFDTSDKSLKTSDLKFILDVVNSDETINSRYDESVQVELYIQYYKKDGGGYLLGSNDTYQVNPYFLHETEGYTNSYEVEVKDEYQALVLLDFVNTSENNIVFLNPQIYNSMDVMSAIDEYGGGGGGYDPGGPPTIEGLTMYSLDGIYTIDVMDGQLTLEVVAPNEYFLQYGYDNWGDRYLDITYTTEVLSGNVILNRAVGNTGQQVTLEDGTTKPGVLVNGRTVWTSAGGNGTFRIRAELTADTTIYTEKVITVRNNVITDIEVIVDSSDGKIHGVGPTKVTLKVKPSTIRDTGASLAIGAYGDTPGGADWTGNLNEYYTSAMVSRAFTDGEWVIYVRGKQRGQVLLSVTAYEFTKEVILDIILPEVSDLTLTTTGGDIGDGTKEGYKVEIATSRQYPLRSDSGYGIESLDGKGKAAVKLLTSSTNNTLTYEIYPIAIGKIKFWGEMYEHVGTGKVYLGRVEQEYDIRALYKELTIEVTTNTGEFKIDNGGGQLEIRCAPNYSYHGGISFSQISVDGGSVNIVDNGDKALITANKNGRVYIVCTPVNGNPVQAEVEITNQYPEDVSLVCGDDLWRLVVNGNLTVYAHPGNTPNPNYDTYNWIGEKLDPDASWTESVKTNYVYLTGKTLGIGRLNCMRRVDNKYMASVILKIVQSLDNDKVTLPFPNSHTYWAVYRRIDQGNRLWIATIAGTVTLDKFTKKADNKLYTDVAVGANEQYRLEGAGWVRVGGWSGGTSPISNVGELFASNLDVYDEAGNLLLAKTDNYDDVDFNKIIYGE